MYSTGKAIEDHAYHFPKSAPDTEKKTNTVNQAQTSLYIDLINFIKSIIHLVHGSGVFSYCSFYVRVSS